MKIEGAVAVIAGGGGGFGSATARELHGAGARVLLLDLDEEKGEAVAADLGEGAKFVRTDVTDPVSVDAALDRADGLGPVRIAVIAHGGPGGGRTLDRENRPLDVDRDSVSVGTRPSLRVPVTTIDSPKPGCSLSSEAASSVDSSAAVASPCWAVPGTGKTRMINMKPKESFSLRGSSFCTSW